MLLAVAFVRARSERGLAESSGSSVTARTVATSGLGRYRRYYDSLRVRPSDKDSLRINTEAGYADVIAHSLHAPTDTMQPEIFVLRSTGYVINPTVGAAPQARYTVARFTQWQTGHLNVTAAFAAAHTLVVASSDSITVSGFDECTASQVTGLLVSDVVPPAPSDFDILNSMATSDPVSIAAATDVNWPDIVNLDAFDADYDSLRLGDNTYPSMLIDGDLVVDDADGYGLLIVTGNLDVEGELFNWRGVILVGGRLVVSGTVFRVQGAVISGLNQLNALPVDVGQLAADVTEILFDSCEIQTAFASLTGFVPLRNAVIENWAY